MATAVDLTEAPSSPPAEAAAFSPVTWACWQSVANGAIAATHAAKAGMQHFVTQVIVKTDADYSAISTFRLLDGATLLLTIPWAVNDRQLVITFPGAGIPCTQGAAVNIDMGTSGGAGIIGMIYASGYTVRCP